MGDTGNDLRKLKGIGPTQASAPADRAVDRVAALAARIFEVPVAIVELIDEEPATLPGDSRGSPQEPAVASPSGVPPSLSTRASVPLTSVHGEHYGHLRIEDSLPRHFTAAELATLRDLAAVIVDEIELGRESRSSAEPDGETIDPELQSAQDIAEVAAAVRVLSSSDDHREVRDAICQISLQLTGADSALLMDLVGDDMRLTVTASAGAPWTLPDVLVADATSPAARAFTGGQPVSVPGLNRDGYAFTLWQPFAAGGRSSVAVLALAWNDAPALASDRLVNLVDLVAAEATGVLERADLLTQLADLATTDELTGLPNRRAINDDLAREMHRARRESTPLCVALLDLDHFKAFNDTNGHPAGDRLLATAASTWRRTLRSGSDLLARYGGEEFLLVLPLPPLEAFATVERLRASTPEAQTLSAGLAHWDGRESAERLIARADIALYAAKAGGRDRTERAAPNELRRRRLVTPPHA